MSSFFRNYSSAPGDGLSIEKIAHLPETSKQHDQTKLVSNWYQHVCRRQCQSRWSVFSRTTDEEADLKARTSTIPIIHRHRVQGDRWITDSITFQDPVMRQILTDVLKGYQDLDLAVENWTFSPPFMPLIHCWDKLWKHGDEAGKDSAVKDALTSMVAFLTPIIKPSILSLGKLKETGMIDFGSLWYIFSPGTLVMTKFYGVDTICQVVKYYKSQNLGNMLSTWGLDLKYIDWNGEKSGYRTTSTSIQVFEGYQRVTKLNVFPISYLDNEAETRAVLIERGRRFEQLQGYHFVDCNGVKVTLGTALAQRRPVTGRVCIDAYAYYRSCGVEIPELQPLDGEEKYVPESEPRGYEETMESMPYSEFETPALEVESAPERPGQRNEDLRPLTEDQLLITTPWLKGFDMKAKDFAQFHIDELKEVTWNDQAFEKLVLPNDQKEIVWAFLRGKRYSDDSGFDDFIQSKGRGLIILMFGPPGVGKTFTAEAVAEVSRVPLYAMSAGDLGTTPVELENALKRALELCYMWNAMLLIDEADVYLSARNNDSLSRNELVCIFLRMLEYYEGTLFLTTNRVTSIDHAFQSRIDYFLPYQDLTRSARRQIWASFLEQIGSGKLKLTDEALDELAEISLNGREIKNLIKSAHMLLLASNEDAVSSMDLLRRLAKTRIEAVKSLNLH